MTASAHIHTISVCICTYRRPQLLALLLSKLAAQRTEGLFEYSIVVVDNDASESARAAVESFALQAPVPVSYHLQPEQNISLARNTAVANAKGDFVAFIDDDEFPPENWLAALYRTIEGHKADGVLAPVLPDFATKPPRWVLKGRFFERPTHPTGHVLDWASTRTGNALLRMTVFKPAQLWFDPRYGSGGEDRDMFRRRIEEGCIFVWCDEAPVYETIPPYRWQRTTLLKRALLRGRMALNNTPSRPLSVLKSGVAVVIYTGCLPVLFLAGHHLFMKVLIKDCDHLGKIAAFLGIDLVGQKYVGS